MLKLLQFHVYSINAPMHLYASSRRRIPRHKHRPYPTPKLLYAPTSMPLAYLHLALLCFDLTPQPFSSLTPHPSQTKSSRLVTVLGLDILDEGLVV
jgi:hypothetical protein